MAYGNHQTYSFNKTLLQQNVPKLTNNNISLERNRFAKMISVVKIFIWIRKLENYIRFIEQKGSYRDLVSIRMIKISVTHKVTNVDVLVKAKSIK